MADKSHFDALVTGAGGFIGGHMVNLLVRKGLRVAAVDIKPWREWWQIDDSGRVANFHSVDLTRQDKCEYLISQTAPEEVYNFAADMGGMDFIYKNRHACMRNVLINTNLLDACSKHHLPEKFFFASSACAYNIGLQTDSDVQALSEDMAYPANPEDGYGWEKLFSERMTQSWGEQHERQVYVARFHNIYGPHGSWDGGREKAPAAISRKVAQSEDGRIEVWGSGEQTRTFCYVDDAVEGVYRLTRSDFHEPINIGSEELVSINELVERVGKIAHKEVEVFHTEGVVGVMGRKSDNALIREKLGWEPTTTLDEGLARTYPWIADQIAMKQQEETVA